ncbi:MAG: Fic/DOC family N-terminal domain-containing protein [Tepidimonas sp.]
MAAHYHLGQFPPTELAWSQLIPLLGPTAAAVAHYDGTLASIPNAAVLLSPLTTQEAVLSSRIEGTQATMGKVLEFEAVGDAPNLSEARRNDIREVLNYRAAMRRAEKWLAELPLSQRVICETHEVLLAGVRGQGKAPGECRRIPNWIGPAVARWSTPPSGRQEDQKHRATPTETRQVFGRSHWADLAWAV